MHTPQFLDIAAAYGSPPSRGRRVDVLSSRASASEAPGSILRSFSILLRPMVPAFLRGDDVLMCCRPGRARARPGIHTPQFLGIAAAYGSPLEPVLAQAGTGTTGWCAVGPGARKRGPGSILRSLSIFAAAYRAPPEPGLAPAGGGTIGVLCG